MLCQPTNTTDGKEPTVINLQKGTASAVVDVAGKPANELNLSAYWRAATQKSTGMFGRKKGAEKVDLDLTLICFRADKQPVAVCNADSPQPFSREALFHTGDKKSGRSGDEENETIMATLSAIPREMQYLAVVINSYAGHTLDSVNQLRLEMFDRTAGKATATHYMPIMGPQNAAIMAVLQRSGDGWTVTPDDFAFSGGRTWRDIAAEVVNKLP